MNRRIVFVVLLLQLNISLGIVENCTYFENNTESVEISCEHQLRSISAPYYGWSPDSESQTYWSPDSESRTYTPQSGCYHNLFEDALGEENRQKIKVIKGTHLCDFEDAKKFENVRELIISPEIIYSAIYPFKSLLKLNLSHGALSILMIGDFKNVPNLMELDVSFNSINFVYGTFFDHKLSLSVMNVSHNQLINLGENSFRGVTKLKILDLSYNKITYLARETFQGNTNLEILRLENNPLFVLSCYYFQQLKKLATLTITMSAISVLDVSCRECSVYVSKNESSEIVIHLSEALNTLHYNKEDMKKLQHFATGDVIQNETEIFDILPLSLEKLDFFTTNSTKLNANIFDRFRDLKSLQLISSNVENIGRHTFENQRNITRLVLSGTNLKNVNCTSLFEPLKDLQILGIANTQFRKMSEIIQSIAPSILWLDVSQNFIGKIDVTTFQKFINLQYLNLSNTNLSNFGFSTFYHQTKLLSLDLSFNHLGSIDFTLFAANFHYLNELHLEGNDLKEIGIRMPFFPQLTKLAISKNLLSCHYVINFLHLWEHVNFIANPSNQTNIKGIDCIIVSNKTSANVEQNISMTVPTMIHGAVIRHEDLHILKYSMLFLCVMCCGYFIVKSKIIVKIRDILAEKTLSGNGGHQHRISTSTLTFGLMNDENL